ncbi:MAG TPA: acyltransferase [Verrucomicrobiae bacterium]|nr:acyltransferase [Verrucomicrobiae bacterium]
MKRIPAIEGLRAYLALWVVCNHVLAFSGFEPYRESGMVKLAMEGYLAVNIFMCISGFVIFLLLDQRRENYRQFICRRFFRIYPLYALVICASVPLAALNLWAFSQNREPFLDNFSGYWRQVTPEFFHNWTWNFPLHLSLFQGLAPNAVAGQNFMQALLPPAWSITLEWQFYLLAPLFFGCATTGRVRRIGLLAVVALAVFCGHRYSWNIGFLPYNLEFFGLGAVSYFACKYFQSHPTGLPGDSLFPVALLSALSLFLLSARAHGVLPLCLWGIFLALILEPPSSLSSRLQIVFTHPVVDYLGNISYSMYLSHWLVLIVVHAVWTRLFPALNQAVYFWSLLGVTITATIGVSALLHRLVEIPGMAWGRRLAAKL